MKKYIESTSALITSSIDHLQLVEYRDEELDYVYGMQEYHTRIRRMFKQIIRIIWR